MSYLYILLLDISINFNKTIYDKTPSIDLIALGALIIAALALFLTYRSRRNFLKENFYAKKIDAYLELQESITNLIIQIILSYNKEKEIQTIKNATNSQFINYQKVLLRHSILFNTNVLRKSLELTELYNIMIETNGDLKPFQKLGAEISIEIRKDMGSNKINKELTKNLYSKI